ncbi:MAG: aspartate 1-decarboxylase [Candidatus Zixiibacteriota bacterium]
MLIHVLRAKIHRARITAANLQYEGSIAVGTDLLAVSTIHVHERVQVVNLNNGVRFETYVIEGKPGEITLNGPAARLGLVGDEVIIIAYALIDPEKDKAITPRIVQVDAGNHPMA